MTLAHNVTRKSNHQFFKAWNENSAYMLGLLEADGCVSNNKITYSAAEKDKEHVYLTHSLLDSDVTVGVAEWKGFKKYRWSITSAELVEDMKLAGYRQGRLPSIPQRLLPHWIRGLFDGDGSIFWDKRHKSLRSNIVFGDEKLAEEVASHLRPITDSILTVYKKTNSDHCWYINMGNQATVKFCNYIYQNSTVALKRKKDKLDTSAMYVLVRRSRQLSHWTRVKTKVTNGDILQKALKRMGVATVHVGTKTITQYGTSEQASIWVDDAIGFKLEKDGTYSMVGDFYHSRGEFKRYYGQNAKFEQEMNCAYAIEDVKTKVDELGFTIDENSDFKIGTDGLIRVQAISYF